MKIYFNIFNYFLKKYIFLNFISYKWGLGIGDWGLGIGDWAQSPLSSIFIYK